MNDLARETLVRAALNGTRQIKNALQDNEGGRCAIGVLMDAYAIRHGISGPEKWWIPGDLLREEYDLHGSQWTEIIWRNNELGEDFLTIARKVGTEVDQS